VKLTDTFIAIISMLLNRKIRWATSFYTRILGIIKAIKTPCITNNILVYLQSECMLMQIAFK